MEGRRVVLGPAGRRSGRDRRGVELRDPEPRVRADPLPPRRLSRCRRCLPRRRRAGTATAGPLLRRVGHGCRSSVRSRVARARSAGDGRPDLVGGVDGRPTAIRGLRVSTALRGGYGAVRGLPDRVNPRRRLAPLLVRTLVVLGGAGILLLLGAAAAGAAETPTAADALGVPMDHPAPLAADPPPIALATPLLPAAAAAVPSGAPVVGGVTVGLGPEALTVAVDPSAAALGGRRSAAAADAAIDSRGRGARRAGDGRRRSQPRRARAPRAKGARTVGATIGAPAAVATDGHLPLPGVPLDPRVPGLALSLLGVAAGAAASAGSTRAVGRGGGSDAACLGAAREVARRLRLGGVRTLTSARPRRGFASAPGPPRLGQSPRPHAIASAMATATGAVPRPT